ncbi:hypothetical protein ABBQ32_011378 [Trebouxia sp. C0010 RCD-2024]
MLFDKVNSDISLTPELREKKLTEITDYLDSRLAGVSSFRSGSRSAQPEKFHGRTADHGQVAKNWWYGVELYFTAEPTHNPVAKAVTYLHDDARYWWQQSGSQAIPSNPTFADFKQVFLSRYVKPSDSAAARAEIIHLKQTGSVEAFATEFRNINSRITVGTPIDTTTLAGYFFSGLKKKVSNALTTHESLQTIHSLALLIPAAEEMEAKHWQC